MVSVTFERFIPLRAVPTYPLNGRFLSLDFDQFPSSLKTEKQLVISEHISEIHSTAY